MYQNIGLGVVETSKSLFIGKTSSDFVGMGLNFKKLFVSA